MTEHASEHSANAEPTQLRALVPYDLPTGTRQRNRAKIVRTFKNWILSDPDRAEKELSLRELNELNLFGSKNTLGSYFRADECKGSPWHALCFMAMEDYLEGVDPEPPPALRRYHSRYQHWRAEAQRAGADGVPLSELKRTDSVHLEDIIDNADDSTDLLSVTTAARIYIKRLHDRLVVNSLLGPSAFVLPRDQAVEAAESICQVAERVIDELVWPKRADITLQVRRNCAAIIDSTVDARRLLSRDKDRQFPELALLLSLRHKDSDLTRAVRTEAGRAMVQYNINHTQALMVRNGASAAGQEIKATEVLLETLAGINAVALRDDVRRLSAGAPPNNAVPCPKIVEVAARLAVYMLVYAAAPTTSSDVSTRELNRRKDFRQRTEKCAKLIIKVFDAELDPSVAQDQADVISLLRAAQTRHFVVGPTTALRILRFRGIGEMLVARMLFRIATTELASDRQIAAIYLREAPSLSGEDGDVDWSDPIREQRRRTMLIERAESLYLRSIDWQRSAGAPKQLRELAVGELAELQTVLDTRRMLQADDYSSAPRTIEAAITRLRSDLDQMIAEGILWADLRQLSELTGDAGLRARRLIGTMAEATRFLKEPEMGLRTDLTPS